MTDSKLNTSFTWGNGTFEARVLNYGEGDKTEHILNVVHWNTYEVNVYIYWRKEWRRGGHMEVHGESGSIPSHRQIVIHEMLAPALEHFKGLYHE